jgi:hypothetical protein
MQMQHERNYLAVRNASRCFLVRVTQKRAPKKHDISLHIVLAQLSLSLFLFYSNLSFAQFFSLYLTELTAESYDTSLWSVCLSGH